MSVYTSVCSRALFPLHERLKGHASVSMRERLELSQWWPREAIESDRVARLRHFLADAGTRVPYYRELFSQNGFDPHGVESVAVEFVETVRGQPHCVVASPGPRHWDIFIGLCRGAEARGNLVTDAYHAALAIESGSEWITRDRDYARFPGLRWDSPGSTPR